MTASGVPSLDLHPKPRSSARTGWLYESYLLYDSGDKDVQCHVHRICEHLTSQGVRTTRDLNDPGSLKGTKALAMSTTAAALVSTGACVVFITKGLLRKANGQGPHGAHDSCSVEINLALSHAPVLIPVVLEQRLRDPSSWPGDVGQRLAMKVGPRGVVDLSGDECSYLPDDEEGAHYASWKVYYELRECMGHIPTVGTPRLGDTAGTPRGAIGLPGVEPEEMPMIEGHGWGADSGPRPPVVTLVASNARIVPTRPEVRGPPATDAPDQATRLHHGGHEGGAHHDPDPDVEDDDDEEEGRRRRNMSEDNEENETPQSYLDQGKVPPLRMWMAVKQAEIDAGLDDEPIGAASPPMDARSKMRIKGESWGAAHSPQRSDKISVSSRRLEELSCEEVVQLLGKLKYGKYAIAFRMGGVDGAALAKMRFHDFGKYGVDEVPLQRRLASALRKFAQRGVPRDFTRGNAWGTLWHCLWGGYEAPHTQEETFGKILTARQERENSMLTPRALAREKAIKNGEILESSTLTSMALLLGGGMAMGGGMGGGIGGGIGGGMGGGGFSPRVSAFEFEERRKLQEMIDNTRRHAEQEAMEDEANEDMSPEERADRARKRAELLAGLQDPGSLELH